MDWPALNHYVEGFQNPRLSFTDPDLKSGDVALDRFGIPRRITGNYAIVFEVSRGQKKWAVRCFSRNVPGQDARYRGVSKRLTEARLDSTVGFEFLTQGIRLKGNWYPLVKMEWIQGSGLDVYLRDHLHSPAALKSLLEGWIALTNNLRAQGIAHGDLQHGNIIITTSGQLKLIDYDGMVISENIAQKSDEIGQRNYQHPSRVNNSGVTAQNYLNIDNFSNWVIGVSIALVCIDPSLWKSTGAGDENLLFRAVDFKQPYRTETWRLLTSHSERRVRELAHRFAEVCQTPFFLDVPPLDPGISNLAVRMVSGAPGWIADHMQASKESAQIDFPDKFVVSVRRDIQSEFKNLPWLERLRFGLQWQNYVPECVNRHYSEFSFAQKKQIVESKIRQLETRKHALMYRISALQQEMAKIENRQRREADAHKEIASLKWELDALPAHLADLDRQQREEIATRIALWLKQTSLKPGVVAGIGEKRVSRLSAIGIRSAADIMSANQPRALNALRGIKGGVPADDWQLLMDWRISLENAWKASPQALIERRQIETRYEDQRQKLLRSQAEKKQRLAALERGSWLSATTTGEYVRLQKEVGTLERELGRIDEQLAQRSSELAKYSRLTSQNLIAKILNI